MMRSLRSRLIAGMFVGMAVLLVAAGTTIYAVQRHQLYHAFDETLIGSAHVLSLLFHPGPGGVEFDLQRVAQLPAGQLRQGVLFEFWSDVPIHVMPSGPDIEPPPDDADSSRPFEDDPPPDERDGGPWDDWSGGPPPDLPFEPLHERVRVIRSPSLNGADLPRLVVASNKTATATITLPDGTRGRAIGLRFQSPTPPGPGPGPDRHHTAELTAVVAASTAEIERELQLLAALLLATALATMTVTGGVAWFVVTRGLRPLAAVADQIAAMNETELKQRLGEREVPREIQPVVSQLNGLLARLDEAFERERSLTADVAHELRTPVAEIRTITEITLSRLRDPEEYRQALGDTLESARSLQGLIEKLLILARLEAGQMPPELDAIAVKPMLAQYWASVSNAAGRRRLVFEDRCDPDMMVTADPKLLAVVLSNALSNAVTYTPEEGCITVETRSTDGMCALVIANTGCELSQEDVARAFDRFWRADVSRANRKGLNCGLGLTLVRRAMEVVGGKAEASVSEDRRFVLTLTFAAPDRDG